MRFAVFLSTGQPVIVKETLIYPIFSKMRGFAAPLLSGFYKSISTSLNLLLNFQ